jgi:transposase
MPAPLPLPVPQAILRRHHRGEATPAIARALGVPERTVRALRRRWRAQAEVVLAPAYQRGARPRTVPSQQLHDRALALRRQHPGWGAGLIRVFLGQDAPAGSLPAERTVQRWFHQAGLGPAPKGRRPVADPTRAQRPHDVWQIDAKELVRLRCGERVSWLRVVDACSGAVLWTAVFPPRQVAEGAPGRGPGPAAAGVWPLGATGHDPRG